jgi:hypothetical protein
LEQAQGRKTEFTTGIGTREIEFVKLHANSTDDLENFIVFSEMTNFQQKEKIFKKIRCKERIHYDSNFSFHKAQDKRNGFKIIQRTLSTMEI